MSSFLYPSQLNENQICTRPYLTHLSSSRCVHTVDLATFCPSSAITHPRCNWFWCWQRSNQLLFIVSLWSRTLPLLVCLWRYPGPLVGLAVTREWRGESYICFFLNSFFTVVALHICTFVGLLARNLITRHLSRGIETFSFFSTATRPVCRLR